MIRAGIIGHPISHSKSPLIHNHWLKTYGIDGDYRAYDIAPGDLKNSVSHLRDRGLAGFNVTIPHKQAIIDHCTTLTRDAEKIGAVNTIKFFENGEIEGRNTDAFGFIGNLKQVVPEFGFKDTQAVILGAGGAARAVIYALQQEGVRDIIVTNRTLEKAEMLADDFNIRVGEWEAKEGLLAKAGLLINTTSLGMKGQAPLNIDLTLLPQEAIAHDIVYAPLMTDFLKAAQARGNRIVTGIGMLLHQARPAFQAWFGKLPEIDGHLQDIVLT